MPTTDKKVGPDVETKSEPYPQMIQPDAGNEERQDQVAEPMTAKSALSGGKRKNSAGLESDIQKHIGQCLQEAYGELVAEPVPDYLIKLLDELAARDKQG